VSADREGTDAEAVGGPRWLRNPWSSPVVVLIVLAGLRLGEWGTLERLEYAWFDAALELREHLGFAQPLDPSIRFVELSMDEQIAMRFARDGEYATAARIVDHIARLGARVIALDIVYTYGRREDQEVLANTLREIETSTATKIVLPVVIQQDSRTKEEVLLRSLPDAGGEAFPHGVVNVSIDSDHLWRRYSPVHETPEGPMPSLALAAFSASRPAMLAARPVEGVPDRMSWKEMGEDGRVQSREVGTLSRFLDLRHSYFNNRMDRAAQIDNRVWTVADLEEAVSDPEVTAPLYDTIVFFGYDEEFDGKPTPLGPQEPGMLLHATALNDLLHGTAIGRWAAWGDVLLFAGVALLAGIAFATDLKKRWLFAVAVAGLVAIGLTGWLLIWFGGVFAGTAAAALVWALAFVGEVARRWGHEQRERTRRDAMLGFYFSPAVLKQVTQDLDMIRPRGSEVAILLSDLRGFTTLCETERVERVFELLNRLFGVETEAALREDGSLARFAGDQFLAYWGAPEGCEDAADRAMRAALEIQRTLTARREAAPEGDPDAWLRIGVGLHFGRGLVGHVGSRDYRDYNLVGDAVNTTARVESQTKNYAAPILATGEFMDTLSNPPDALRVDHVRVKGRRRPVELHAVFLDPGAVSRESRRAYDEAFERYARGDFAGAVETFASLEDDDDETIARSASVLRERSTRLAAAPPQDWNGVFELTGK